MWEPVLTVFRKFELYNKTCLENMQAVFTYQNKLHQNPKNKIVPKYKTKNVPGTKCRL